MELSLFLAKFFGVYYLIFAFLWIWRQDQIKDIIKDLTAKHDSLAITGIISLIIGVAIVVSHTVYEWNWRGFITLLGYIGIIKGIIRISFPKQSKTMAHSLLKGSSYWFTFLVVVIIGLYLTYVGFNITF